MHIYSSRYMETAEEILVSDRTHNKTNKSWMDES